MTTIVTVDAHAGWDIEVKVAELREDGWYVQRCIVPKFTVHTFYVHSAADIWGIREIKPE